MEEQNGGWTLEDIIGDGVIAEWFGDQVENLVLYLNENANFIFEAIKWPIEQVLNGAESFLIWLPWPIVILAFILIGYFKSGWRIATIAGVGFILLRLMGDKYWELTMTTLSMILTAMIFCIVVGVPLGILAARNDTFESILRPILDGMQTIHPFVYLIPVVMFFGIRKVPGTMATVFFALPPMIRLTNLGIRQVQHDVIEAAQAFGSGNIQMLFDVQLPLAMPTIMAGLNQTLMLALSMVVIVALISGGGLGQEIFAAVSGMQTGRAVVSGFAVLILAIVLDRVSQVKGVGSHA